MISEDRLKNWGWWCAYGPLGPEVRTCAASAEGNYESEDVFEGEEPRIEPDMLDGQMVEDAVRELPDISRRVLKARYIQYPYNLSLKASATDCRRKSPRRERSGINTTDAAGP